jgi:hypothetical protein
MNRTATRDLVRAQESAAQDLAAAARRARTDAVSLQARAMNALANAINAKLALHADENSCDTSAPQGRVDQSIDDFWATVGYGTIDYHYPVAATEDSSIHSLLREWIAAAQSR